MARRNYKLERLQEGETFITNEKGNSMVPLIKSGQVHKLAPATLDEVQVGDIVYCKVKGSFYTHLVKAKDDRKGVQISNNRGHINGWTKAVYGVVIEVIGGTHKRKRIKNKPMNKVQDKLKATVRDVADFPREGIVFKDITPVLADAQLCTEIVDEMYNNYKDKGIDAIAGIESRGFFFGFLLANRLGVPFITIRKKGKLPFETVSIEYDLEYGTAVIEMNSDAVTKDMNVLVHDDLLATGGTAAAAAELISKQGGKVAGFGFVISLDFLEGKKNLTEFSDNIYEIISY